MTVWEKKIWRNNYKHKKKKKKKKKKIHIIPDLKA